MQWSSITGSWRHDDTQPGLWDREPSGGSLPIRQAARLAALLSGHTAKRGRCWFGVWDGFGALAVPREGVTRVRMPQRPMLVLSGPLSAVTTSLERAPWDQRANLWWPEDRAWCVATDVDLMSTYVAGSRACIAAVVASTDLEAMATSVDERIDWGSDTLNPLPPGGGG